MAASRIRTSDLASKRRINRTRDIWLGFFQDALNSLLSSDEDQIKEVTDEEAANLASTAARIADKALAETEERFPGL